MTGSHLSSRILATLSLVAVSFTGAACSAPGIYGTPDAPSAKQTQAAELLQQLAGAMLNTMNGQSHPREAWLPHALTAKLHEVLGRGETPIRATGLTPRGLEGKCVNGWPGGGYTFTDCRVDNGTIQGKVTVVDGRVAYDLRLNHERDGIASRFELRGEQALVDGRLRGHLVMRMDVLAPLVETVGGIASGNTTGGFHTTVNWDVALGTDSAACLDDGTVEVGLEVFGRLYASRFGFKGCAAAPQVENGRFRVYPKAAEAPKLADASVAQSNARCEARCEARRVACVARGPLRSEARWETTNRCRARKGWCRMSCR